MRTNLIALLLIIGFNAAVVGQNNPQIEVIPVSTHIAAGAEYKFKMYIPGVSTEAGATCSMFFNEKEIEILNGIGTAKFSANYSGIPDRYGVIKKTFNVKVNCKPSKGNAFESSKTVEYYVYNPAVIVSSKTVQSLYKNCGNEVSFDIPSLGERYNPSFQVVGGTMKSGYQKGSIVIVPTDPRVTVTINSNGQKISEQDFAVQLVPKPSVDIKSNGRAIDRKRGVAIADAANYSNVLLEAKADDSFRRSYPKDSRYKTTKWDATLVRGDRPVEKQSFDNSSGDLSGLISQAKTGDRILVEVKEVTRKTYLNENEIVRIGQVIFNIPLY